MSKQDTHNTSRASLADKLEGIAVIAFVIIFAWVVVREITPPKTWIEQNNEVTPEVLGQQNLLGICAETKTNLYSTLGRQKFFELAEQKYLDTLRVGIKEFLDDRNTRCPGCGLYTLPLTVTNLQDWLKRYQENFQQTAFLDLSDSSRGLVNDPLKVLDNMGLTRLDLDKPISVDSLNGFLYVQFRYGASIQLLGQAGKNNLLTFDEMPKSTREERGHLKSEEERKQGKGNYYIRFETIVLATSWPYSTLEQTTLGRVQEKFRAISNCGDRVGYERFFLEGNVEY